MTDWSRTLRTQFDEDGSTCIFYRYRWSKGVAVSRAEMEAHLQAKNFQEMMAFYKSVKDRPGIFPRRPFWKNYFKSLSAMPMWTGLISLGLGARLILSPPFEQGPLVVQNLFFGLAGLLVLHGFLVLTAHLIATVKQRK